jgi:hypothetical protein
MGLHGRPLDGREGLILPWGRRLVPRLRAGASAAGRLGAAELEAGGWQIAKRRLA